MDTQQLLEYIIITLLLLNTVYIIIIVGMGKFKHVVLPLTMSWVLVISLEFLKSYGVV